MTPEPASSRLVLSDDEQWSPGDPLPTTQEIVEGLGLEYRGLIEAAPPLMVPPPLFAKIQAWDREQAAAGARKQELMEIAIDLLGVDRVAYYPVIDLDSGVVTLTPRETVSS